MMTFRIYDAVSQIDAEKAVYKYLDMCKDPGCDVIEISSGFLSLLVDDWLRLCERVMQKDPKPKPDSVFSSVAAVTPKRRI